MDGTDVDLQGSLAAIRGRLVDAVAGDDEVVRVLDRVWPADWSDAPLAAVWMLANAQRILAAYPPEDGYGAEFMQAWIDRLVWPNGEPRDDPEPRAVGAREMLDMICDAVVVGMEGGERKVHVTLQRDIEDADGTLAEFVIVEAFKCAHAAECGEPFHVRVLSAEPRYAWPHHEEHRTSPGAS